MALTRLGRNLIVVVTLGIVGGGGYYFAKEKGLFEKKEQPVGVATGFVQQPTPDAASTPAVPPDQVALPVYSPQPAEQVQQQAPVADPSTNRGMQFLLNQGKQ